MCRRRLHGKNWRVWSFSWWISLAAALVVPVAIATLVSAAGNLVLARQKRQLLHWWPLSSLQDRETDSLAMLEYSAISVPPGAIWAAQHSAWSSFPPATQLMCQGRYVYVK